jgi:hypothetical protein
MKTNNHWPKKSFLSKFLQEVFKQGLTSIHSFIQVFVNPPILLSICLSIHPSVLPFICPLVHLSFSLPKLFYVKRRFFPLLCQVKTVWPNHEWHCKHFLLSLVLGDNYWKKCWNRSIKAQHKQEFCNLHLTKVA